MNLVISITLSLLLALLAFYKKALTNNALFLAFIFSIIITFFGGISSLLILAMVFILTLIASKIKQDKRNKINANILKKHEKKDTMEIIANVATGTLILIIYGLTNNSLLKVVYASIMAESIADSLASDIGILSKKDPINILTFKRSTPGLSGNTSLLGIFASFIGSLIIALIYFIFTPNIMHLIIITLSGTIGNLIDSFLGATLQVKYQCPKCNIITEQETHCNNKTKRIKGYKILDNDIINLITNIIAGLISYIMLTI